jgi:hypothetical protein
MKAHSVGQRNRMKAAGSPVVERAEQAGRHRIRYWNQVGFWVKADFASGSAAKDL